MFKLICVLLLICVTLATSGAAYGETLVVFFRLNGDLYAASRDVTSATPEAAIAALMAGPTASEAAAGVASAIPREWTVESLSIENGYLVVSLGGIAAGAYYPDDQIDDIISQFDWTVRQFGLAARLLVGSEPISILRFPEPPAAKPAKPAAPAVPAAGGKLAGKKICISPGHGYYWNGSTWNTQRVVYCAPLTQEDFHNVDHAILLIRYLEAEGATIINTRETNKNRGNSPYNNLPWWQMGGGPYLYDKGYPASVYAPLTGVPPGTPGVDQTTEDRRTRPEASDYEGADLYISLHTNGYQGDCYVPPQTSCPTGIEMYYDSTKQGGNAALSQTLADICEDNTSWAVNTYFGSFACRNSCNPRDAAYTEIHYPDAPACLLEFGFHDTCQIDAAYMLDPLFTSAGMYGMYKGICQFFGVTPSYDAYSAEYVSDDIPATAVQGDVRTVHVTFRNRGVVWSEAHQFRLGAVGDSDPFANPRQTISGGATVSPGDTYTFTFTMTFSAPGTFITDWRMLREGVAWFGDTLTKQVTVLPPGGDNEPPTAPGNLQASSDDYNVAHLSWTASTDNIGVTQYEIWRNGSPVGTVDGSLTSYDDTGLTQNTIYSYQVRAKDAAGNYSPFSNTASARTWAIVAQDSFANLNQWTPARVQDGTIRGVSLDASVGSDLPGGSGPPSARADVGSIGNNGSYSYIGFGAPFAVAYIQCSFKDSGTYNDSRQGIAFRKFQNDDPSLPRLVYFLGLDSTAGYGGYDAEVFSASGGWTKHADVGGTRTVGWHRFKISIDGSNIRYYVDGVLKDTIQEPAEKDEGVNRFYIGHNYNVNKTGWYDDFLGCAPVPPTPTMLAPTDVGINSVTWNYSEGGQDWEQGFYIRDGAGTLKAVGARNSTSVTETGIPANTTCTRSVSAFNGPLESSPSGFTSAVTLSVPPSAENVTSNPAVGAWTNGTVSFTSLSPFGPGGVQYYRYAFDQSPTHVWTGSESVWDAGVLQAVANANGSWYLHLQGFNSANVANGTLDVGPFYFDGQAPVVASVNDDGDWTASQSELHFTWAASDVGSGISGYEYAIGTTALGTDVRGWTSVGVVTDYTAQGLSLAEGQVYYASVRASDVAGNVSAPVSSDGIRIAPIAAKISDAKLAPAGAYRQLLAKPVVARWPGRLYIEEADRSAAIAVVTSGPGSLGEAVDVVGTLSGSGAERFISADYVGVVGTATPPAPVFMAAASVGGSAFGPTPGAAGGIGLNNVGMLVTIAGRTSGRDPLAGRFIVTDGSGSIPVEAPGLDPPADGAFVRVTGIVRLDASLAPYVAPRSQAEVQVL